VSVLLAIALGAASGALASGTTRVLFRRRHARHRAESRMAVFDALDDDAQVALEVAIREASTRKRHVALVDVLWGLLQVDAFTAAIAELGGDVAAIEQRVLDALEQPAQEQPAKEPPGAAGLLGYALAHAQHYKAKSTCATLWVVLARTNVGALVDQPNMTAHDLSFYLVHGARAPAINLTYGEANVVLRNDDYTTVEFVVSMLREIFALSQPDAERLAKQVNDEGRGVAGRFPLDTARAKVEAARTLACREVHPLWIGVEPA
jgi:ATP-dependent Clp protease adaptor protein ClpS